LISQLGKVASSAEYTQLPDLAVGILRFIVDKGDNFEVVSGYQLVQNDPRMTVRPRAIQRDAHGASLSRSS
jgi:hypothetical protein